MTAMFYILVAILSIIGVACIGAICTMVFGTKSKEWRREEPVAWGIACAMFAVVAAITLGFVALTI